jgi:hypothetical protein
MAIQVDARDHPRAIDEPSPRAGRGDAPADAPGTSSVIQALLVAVLALSFAALLNAEALADTASAQPFGWRRDVATTAVDPILSISRALHLTAPRRWVEDALDQPHPRSDAPSAVVTTTTAPSTTSSLPGGTTSTTLEPDRRQPSANAPLRLLVAGDSMTEALGPGILDAADRTGVVSGTHELRYSSGLTRPDYFDWPAELATLLARDDPEAIVVMLGANDAQGILTANGPAGFGSPDWVAEYRVRVAAVMDLLRDGARTVYWIGQPIMRSDTFDARMRLVSDIYRQEAERRDGIRFIDTRAMFAKAGAYSDYLPGSDGNPVLVRREDGIHLTPAGADRLAAAVIDAIGDDWHITEEERR